MNCTHKNETTQIEIYLGLFKIKSIKKFCETYGINRRTVYNKIKDLCYGIHTIDIAYLQLTVIKDVE